MFLFQGLAGFCFTPCPLLILFPRIRGCTGYLFQGGRCPSLFSCMGCCATTGWPSFIVTRTSFNIFLFQGLAGFWFLHFLTGGPFTTPFSRLFPFWAEQRGNNLSLQKRLETHTPRGFSHTHTHANPEVS